MRNIKIKRSTFTVGLVPSVQLDTVPGNPIVHVRIASGPLTAETIELRSRADRVKLYTSGGKKRSNSIGGRHLENVTR